MGEVDPSSSLILEYASVQRGEEMIFVSTIVEQSFLGTPVSVSVDLVCLVNDSESPANAIGFP